MKTVEPDARPKGPKIELKADSKSGVELPPPASECGGMGIAVSSSGVRDGEPTVQKFHATIGSQGGLS